MHKARLEAFSDGVIAIIITIMVLELKPPHEPTLQALIPLSGALMSYALSFLYVAIYWNNHHHMLHTAERVNGRIMWANMHLLFWLSLTPFATAWLGESHFAKGPAMAYGFVLLTCAVAYYLLQTAIIIDQGPKSNLAAAIGADYKGKLSPVIYVVAMIASYWAPWVSMALYAFAAAIWFIPDRRIARRIDAS